MKLLKTFRFQRVNRIHICLIYFCYEIYVHQFCSPPTHAEYDGARTPSASSAIGTSPGWPDCRHCQRAGLTGVGSIPPGLHHIYLMVTEIKTSVLSLVPPSLPLTLFLPALADPSV